MRKNRLACSPVTGVEVVCAGYFMKLSAEVQMRFSTLPIASKENVIGSKNISGTFLIRFLRCAYIGTKLIGTYFNRVIKVLFEKM